MKGPVNVSRRHFLTVLGLSTAGLCLGVHASQPTNEIVGDTDPKPKTSNQAEQDKSVGLNPNVFIHIASSGLVSIICHRSEMGQGIRSSLPVLIADELGADMKNVKVIQAEGDKKYGDQNTDGSSSIRGKFELMRKAAATARVMLIEAAAQKWKVKASTLTTEKGYVLQRGTKKKLSFGELAVAAGKLDVPKPEVVTLRPIKELKNLGRDLPLLDGHDYVTGKAVFGADVKLPNMLIAVIARPTVVGGKVKKANTNAAVKIAGVKKVIHMPEPKAPYAFQPWGGVAVLATNTWAAIQGRDALEVSWDHGANASYESGKFRETLFKSAEKGGTTYRKKGDVESALKTSAKTLEASYYVPHIAHMPMETPVAIAHYKKEEGGFCEVWAATQNPQAARTEVARVLGLTEDKVRINVTLLGGGFGRKSKADFCSEAAWLSREVGAPVRVQFTREDDLHNDYLNTVGAQTFKAGLDKDNKVVALKWRTAFPPIPSLFNASVKEATPRELQQGVLDIALDIPNIEAQACEAQSHIRTGWLRSVYNIFHAFGASSFLDEIAHETKQDPLAFLQKVYANRIMDLKDLGVEALYNYGLTLEQSPVDGKRLLGVLNSVASQANWKNRKASKERGFGIAVHRSFSSYVAVVAAVMKDKSGKIKVDEVWISIDAGIVVNTDRVRAQMEGSIINGMTYFFNGGVTHKDGAVVESNFDEVPIMTMSQVPRKIHVDIVKSEAAPGGVGEPGLPPVAPAIGNAIFALTGKRIREFASKELA